MTRLENHRCIRRCITALCALCLVPGPPRQAAATDTRDRVPQYKRIRLLLRDGKFVNLRDGALEGDSLVAMRMVPDDWGGLKPRAVSFPIREIRGLSYSNHHLGMVGMIVGAVVGAMCPLIVLKSLGPLAAPARTNLPPGVNANGITGKDVVGIMVLEASSMAIFGLAGYGLGAQCYIDWQTVPLPPARAVHPAPAATLSPGPVFRLRLRF